jgi:hypothetical protein
MSSNFRIAALCFIVCAMGGCAPAAAATAPRFAEVVKLTGGDLSMFDATAIDRLALLTCSGTECHPIPFQVDERDAAGHWVLDQGPLPTADDPPGTLDGNDLLLFMAADAGDRAPPGALPVPPACHGGGKRALEPAGCGNLPSPLLGKPGLIGAEITLHDPLDGSTRWAYLVALMERAARAPAGDVAYDPVTDRVRGQRVSLGFSNGVPGYLAMNNGANLLDRLKVRASATLLFGLIHFTRSEADLRTQFMGWHAGPIRVVRGQRQWVRLGWGIHSPTFGSYTYFYRDFAELPVGLFLNFKPTYFFGNIVVQVILDFRDLRGWSLLVPSVPEPIPIDGTMTPQKAALALLSDKWFALRGPEMTLLQSMDVSPSLASVRHRLIYRETTRPEPPETVPGEAPGIGYQLDEWEDVGAGAHQLESVSYALPPDVDVREFMRTRETPLEVSVHRLTK